MILSIVARRACALSRCTWIVDCELSLPARCMAFCTNASICSSVIDRRLGENGFFKETLTKIGNVQDVLVAGSYAIILHRDGSVEMIRKPEKDEKLEALYNGIEAKLESWQGIVSIQRDGKGIYGIRYDGTVCYVSTDIYLHDLTYVYDWRQGFTQEVEAWIDIVCIASETSHYANDENEDYAWGYAIGVTYDGAVVSTGNGTYYETVWHGSTIADGYSVVEHSGGFYHDVSDWKLW